MIKNENYITIQGWMIKELNLKGNELLVYSVIYGFSQNEEDRFTGSLQYLADWCNSTKQSVLKCLQSLLEKGLIRKEVLIKNGVKFCEYSVTPIKQSLTPPIKQSLMNNIDNNKIDNNIYSQVCDYLNEKCGTHYKANTPKTQQLIKARQKEGFELDDFKKVIDNMSVKWKHSEWEQYLRPETLFGTKFESYLNVKNLNYGNKNTNFEQRVYEKDELNSLFDNLDNIVI